MEKKKFEVQEHESIAQCLDRMKKEGFTPIRRMEKPIFQEIKGKGQVSFEPVAQQIIFEAVKLKG